MPTALAPCDFTSLGVLNATVAGTYTLNTSGSPSLTGPGGVNFTGVVSGGIAVFDFASVNIGAGVVINASGSRPLAILSLSTITIAGTINGSGQSALDFQAFVTQMNDLPAGGPGGGAGGLGNPNPLNPGIPDPYGAGITDFGVDNGGRGQGPGGGGANRTGTDPKDTDPTTNSGWWGYGGAGGGGFGGVGARGATNNSLYLSIYFAQTETHTGAAGGVSYGNLFNLLQGGSGGGGSDLTGGGGGGGAIELGAITQITISASGRLNFQGGNGAVGNTASTGGGSGGGVLLHAARVTNRGIINVHGGLGGLGPTLGTSNFAAGGGGAGGRVAVIVATATSNFVNTGTIDRGGGQSGVNDPGNPNPPISLPPNSFTGPGVPSPDPTGGQGTLNTRAQPLPPAITPLTAAQIRIYLPVRWTYNAQTGFYSGYVTLINNGAVDFTGPFALVFTQLPRGVTVANSSVSTGGPICNGSMSGNIFGDATVPSGLTFLNVTGDLINPSRGGGPLRVFVQLRNPLHVNLGTFFASFSYALQLYQGQFF